MNYLLDTCLISELRKPKPNQSVLDWFNNADENSLFISSLTIGELCYGITLLPESDKKNEIQLWLEEMKDSFTDQVIGIDDNIAHCWGVMRATAQRSGRSLGVIDGLLAATCQIHKLVLVTRNIQDFNSTGISLFNPWS